MSSHLFLRRWALAIAVVAAGVLASGASASAATGPLVWGSPVTYQNFDADGGTATLFSSITCPSAGDCVAAGYNETAEGLDTPAFAVESGGVWGAAISVAPPAVANTSATAVLNSISCPSANSCVAAGFYTNTSGGTDAMVVPITLGGGTGVPGTATEVTLPMPAAADTTQAAALNGVSCGADGCEAVGQYVDASGNTQPMLAAPSASGTWSATEVTPAQLTPAPGSDIRLNSISCPSSGSACEAVGNYDDASGDIFPWAVQINGRIAGTAQNISMPADFVPSPPGVLSFVLENGLDEVSCPSAGACTAAGSYPTSAVSDAGYAVPITSGTPGTVVEVAPSTSGEATFVDGLSCSDAGDCVLTGTTIGDGDAAADTFGSFYSTETAGSWATPTGLNEGVETFVVSLGCSSETNCTAYGDALGILSPSSTTTFFIVSSPALSVVTSSLPGATVGVPYSGTLQAAGGSGTDNWSVTSGTLPAGLSLNATTGVISGTPTTNGSAGFVVTDTDPGPPVQTATGSLSIAVAPAPVSTPATATPAPIIVDNPGPVATTPTVTTASAKAVAKLVKASAKGNKVSVTVSCSGAACRGTLTLTTTEHLKGVKITAVTARAAATATAAKAKTKPKTKMKTVTLAKGGYTIAAGKSTRVTLTLKGAAAKLLSRRHSIPAKLALTPSGSKKTTATKTITLKAVAKTKKKK
jgi:large repetitive protein